MVRHREMTSSTTRAKSPRWNTRAARAAEVGFPLGDAGKCATRGGPRRSYGVDRYARSGRSLPKQRCLISCGVQPARRDRYAGHATLRVGDRRRVRHAAGRDRRRAVGSATPTSPRVERWPGQGAPPGRAGDRVAVGPKAGGVLAALGAVRAGPCGAGTPGTRAPRPLLPRRRATGSRDGRGLPRSD